MKTLSRQQQELDDLEKLYNKEKQNYKPHIILGNRFMPGGGLMTTSYLRSIALVDQIYKFNEKAFDKTIIAEYIIEQTPPGEEDTRLKEFALLSTADLSSMFKHWLNEESDYYG